MITTRILSFLGIGEILMLGQKKIKLNFKKRRLKEMILLTIMSVKKIELFDELFEIRDEGLDGFVIERENVYYYNDFTGYPFVRFRCFDDYLKFFDIDCWLHFLYSEECDRSSLIREDERLFYNNLKEVEKIVDYCKEMKLTYVDIKNVIYIFFGQIGNFIREYEDGFKHNNKKVEKSLMK